MADKKIADLQEATTATDTDILIIEDNANTKKITWANLKTAIIGAFSSILGNRTYTEQNVVTSGETLTASIDKLDVDLASHKAEKATQANLGHVKTPENWVNLPLEAGWSGMLRYRRNDLKQVEITSVGGLTIGTSTANTIIATLPVGYRPTDICTILCLKSISNNGVAGLFIDAVGNVKITPEGTALFTSGSIRITATFNGVF